MRRRKTAPVPQPTQQTSESPDLPPTETNPPPKVKVDPEGGEGARRAILADVPEPDLGEGDTCPIDRTPTIRHVPTRARRMVTITDTWSCWSAGLPLAHGSMAGELVRLCPPLGVTPARVEEVADECRRLGAVAVKVVPPERQDQVAGLEVAVDERAPRRTIREVVLDLVQTAAGTGADAGEYVPELAAVVVEALEVGEREAPPKVVPSQGEPVWIEGVVLKNWFRYRGTHALTLEPTVYGVTATAEGDPERSNWQGKSSLMNAVAFAFYGWLPDYVRGADDWITRGEEDGGVRLTLSDGSVVDRSRKRGKSTQLYAGIDGSTSNQVEAQKWVSALLGLSEDDFLATAFFPQREIARLVRAKPAERLEVVRGWLDLDALGAAEEWARRCLAFAVERERKCVHDRDWQGQEVQRYLRVVGISEQVSDRSDTTKMLDREWDIASNRLVVAQRDAKIVERQVAEIAGWERDEQVWQESQRVSKSIEEFVVSGPSVEEVEKARAQLPKLKELETWAKSELTRAQDEVQQKCQLAKGEFDGNCPVARVRCPIAEQISGNRVRNLKLRAEAESELARAGIIHRGMKTDVEGAERVLVEVADVVRRTRELEAKLEGMRLSVVRIEQEGHPPDRSKLPDPRPHWKSVGDAEQRMRLVDEARAGIQQAWEKLDEIEAERASITRRVRVLRDAVRVLGRGGAQKVVAVAELARIEAAANELLRQHGVDLSVSVRWGRESSTQLSSTCEECGREGITGNAKTCPTCKATRAPKVSEKLDVELSDRSGAAEDLGGLTLQVAASAWLRERRGARFAAVLIDEPFGALDAAHARALSTHLAGILRGRSFRQALVVAHTPSAMDALPGRIRVTGLRDGSSKVEVER